MLLTTQIVLPHFFLKLKCVHIVCALLTVSVVSMQVFDEVLMGVRKAAADLSVMDDKVVESFFVLTELCDIRKEGSNFRPICQMVLVPVCDKLRSIYQYYSRSLATRSITRLTVLSPEVYQFTQSYVYTS